MEREPNSTGHEPKKRKKKDPLEIKPLVPEDPMLVLDIERMIGEGGPDDQYTRNIKP
jgi:hypothetical protein